MPGSHCPVPKGTPGRTFCRREELLVPVHSPCRAPLFRPCGTPGHTFWRREELLVPVSWPDPALPCRALIVLSLKGLPGARSGAEKNSSSPFIARPALPCRALIVPSLRDSRAHVWRREELLVPVHIGSHCSVGTSARRSTRPKNPGKYRIESRRDGTARARHGSAGSSRKTYPVPLGTAQHCQRRDVFPTTAPVSSTSYRRDFVPDTPPDSYLVFRSGKCSTLDL